MLRAQIVFRNALMKRRMYKFASIGETTPPCGVLHVVRCPPVNSMLPVLVAFFNWDLQPRFQQAQQLPVNETTSHSAHQLCVRNSIDVLGRAASMTFGRHSSMARWTLLTASSALRCTRRHSHRSPLRISVRERAWLRFGPIDLGWSVSPAASRLLHQPLESSRDVQLAACNVLSVPPLAVRKATALDRTLRCC